MANKPPTSRLSEDGKTKHPAAIRAIARFRKETGANKNFCSTIASINIRSPVTNADISTPTQTGIEPLHSPSVVDVR